MLPNLRHILSVLLGLAFSTVAQGANLIVDCNRGTEDALPTISSALKRLNPEGPNTVTVSGACKENVVLQGFDRLMLIARPGASISDASAGSANVIDISDSQRVTVQGFTINGGADGVDCHNHSFCHFQGNTIQGSSGTGVSVRDSQADFNGDVLQDHGFDGLEVIFLGFVGLTDVTIQRNAILGVVVANNSFFDVFGSTKIQNNGGDGLDIAEGGFAALFSGTVSGNSGDGVSLETGSKASLHGVISGNAGHGVSVGNLSAAVFGAASVVRGNQSSPDVLCYEKFSVTRGAQTNLGSGTTNCTDS